MAKLALGTVQLGMDYVAKRPRVDEALDILAEAHSAGIDTFDTAQAYGSAEKLLGVAALPNDCKIITKQYPHVSSVSLVSSLLALNRSKVFAFLLHTPSQMYDLDIVRALAANQNAGLCDHVGVSVYSVADALHAASADWVGAIEFPYSLLDQRLDYTDFFIRAAGKVLLARQPFARGELFRSSIDFCGIAPERAGLQFVLSRQDIDYCVFGVDNLQQLEADIKAAKCTLPRSVADQIWAASKKLDPVVPPSLWAKV